MASIASLNAIPSSSSSSSSPFKLVFPNAFKSFSILDYLFNPCSIMSVEFYITAVDYQTYFTSVSRNSPLYLNFDLMDRMITGQVMSFQTSKTGSQASPFLVSAMLMPVGAANTSTANFSKDTIGSGQTIISKLVGPKFKVNAYADHDYSWNIKDPIISMPDSNSIIGGILAYRKAYAIEGFRQFMADVNNGLNHKFLYLFFGLVNDHSQSSPVLDANAGWGDFDFTKAPPTSTNFRKFISDLSDVSQTFVAGNQAMANSAFSFIPRLNNQYFDIITQSINETYKVTFVGKQPGHLYDLLFPKNIDFDNGHPPFSGFIVTPPSDSVVPSWRDQPVRHIRTLYQWSNDNTQGNMGHITQFTFGRLNPSLAPHGY